MTIKVNCDDRVCEYNKKTKEGYLCTAEEIQISNTAECLTATDTTDLNLDEEDNFKEEER